MNTMLHTSVPRPALAADVLDTREPRVVVHDVTWHRYQMIGSALSDRPGMRLTFDRGTLEIKTTSSWHEILKTWVSRVIEVMAEEFGRPYVTAGNMTFQREDTEKGIEGDNCYWFAAEALMRTRQAWDPEQDPPPELLLEIEVSRSALSRMAIYAALGIAEIWRFDRTELQIHKLQPNGAYRIAERSLYFPEIPPEDLSPYCTPNEDMSVLAFLREFRAWVRKHVPAQ